ncbi:zinc finger CCCH domain-containing protein 13-like [Sardina pilchardus]|uniref:zinc finger CCCH domain-containing protein 13-like n=1 Tax=Sardina pilchardus TaxID=27697 RepID=UPI002E0EE1FF
MDRERQRRHRERVRADPEKQQAYRERERQRYQRRKNMVISLPEQMTTESQSHGLSNTEYQTGPSAEDHSHPNNYSFQAMSQNSDTETGNMGHMDDMVMKKPTPDIVDTRQQIKEMNPVSYLLRVTEKETPEHLFSTQHRAGFFGSQDVNYYFVQQNGDLCSHSRSKKRLMDRERQRRYRERIRSNPVKQSDDVKERRRFMDRERQRRRRERMRAEPDQQQAYAERERQRLLDRERQRRCRQRLQADPVRWQAYLEKERHRSREAARRSRAKKSLAKALTGWISV